MTGRRVVSDEPTVTHYEDIGSRPMLDGGKKSTHRGTVAPPDERQAFGIDIRAV